MAAAPASQRFYSLSKNGQKKKLVLKITRKMQTDKTGVTGADPAENQTPSYSAEVELKGMK